MMLASRRIVSLSILALWALLATPLFGQPSPEEEAASRALKGIASNIQNNLDGTVRFVRFSKTKVTDEHLSHLREFNSLDYLAVVTPTVTDAGLSNIEGLTNLDTLLLSDSGLTDSGTHVLRALKKLERLYLDGTKITDASLAHIVDLKSLTTLSLQRTAITDGGLEHIAGLNELEALFLSDSRVTNRGLKQLRELTRLRTLYLDRCEVSAAGLEHLVGLESLETLSLSETTLDLTDAVGLPAVKQVLLYDTRFTLGDAVQVKGAFPNAAVHVNPGPEQDRNVLERLLAGATLQSGGETQVVGESGRRPDFWSGDPLDLRETPDFQRHVIPLLGRLGCNGRTCHGSFQGQGGFRLSMFGYDFAADLEALSERIDPASPDDSLILLKPTLQVDHEGGLRYEKDGWAYQLLRRWIEGGAHGVSQTRKIVRFELRPEEVVFSQTDEEVQLQAMAEWSDGTREDVTSLARFQTNDEDVATVTRNGLVGSTGAGDTHIISFYDNAVFSCRLLLPVSDRTGPDCPPALAPTRIDELVVAKLSKLGVVPAELSSDEEFLRRVSLDMIGTLPTAGDVTTFVKDPSSDKRSKKIDELLETPAYAQWWTVRLSDLTGSNAQYLGTTDVNRPAAEQWNAWLHRRLDENIGWDRISAGIILAKSRRPAQTYEEYTWEQSSYLRTKSPADFTSLDNPMHYYWFRNNNQEPTDRALSVGYVFLGVRLQCAQCHKHPFDQWSKDDFDKFTQFFTRIQMGIAPDAREAQTQLKTKLGVPEKLNTAALRRQMYRRVAGEGLPIPWNEIWIEPPGDEPQIAKLLGGEEIDLSQYDDPREPLMAWMLRRDNAYFARAFVNRIWAHYFGVGIIDPPDDLNLANPPSNKALSDWLSEQFIEHDYDIKWLHRTITNSRTYQLSWRTNETNRTDDRNFSRALIRRLHAEVTIDAILQATANDRLAASYRSDVSRRKIGQHPLSIQTRSIDYSLLVFGKPLRTTNCDCERQMQPTLLQSLYVRNDHELLEWLERKDGWLVQVADELGLTLSPEVSTSEVVSTEREAELPDDSLIVDLIKKAYLRTLSRLPREDELVRARSHLGEAENTVEGLRDVMWALLNTQEFLTNH